MRTVADPKRVRTYRVAGVDGFYPDDPVELTQRIAKLFTAAKRETLPGPIAGLVCPHAGYDYSGAIAATGYKQLTGLSFSTVVVISPSHRAFFRGCSVYSGGAYRTPLGDIPVDLEFCARLTETDPLIALSDIGHEAIGGGFEHGLEVHLPFLQIVLGQFSLVPIVMGDQEYPTARRLGELLGSISKLGRTLIVASSDLAHGHDYQTTRRLDATAAEAIQAFSHNRFYDLYSDGACEACGGGPITAAMIATHAMGANCARVLGRTTSADVTGDRAGYIVGYLSAAFFRGGNSATEREYSLTEDDTNAHDITDHSTFDADHTLNASERELLRTTARRSLEHAIKGAKIECPEAPTARLREKRGVFVTLKHHGDLRGCVGYVRPFKPLIEAVWEMAESAALRDHRFIPVEPRDVDRLELEITVLSPIKKISDPNLVLVGRHGLIVSRGHISGVLLPQVPIENDWNRETFLSETCIKAGLPVDSWKDPDTILEVFTAEIF
jgi:AmmeMemoRadiSam system protein B/AmmeMemoRadiSam system protein A